MSKRIAFLLTFAIALTLLGCNSNERTYYVKYARIRSLRNSAPVLCEQAPVGVLTGLSNLPDETLLLKIELNKEFLLEKDDTIALVDYGDFYDESLEIIRGKGKSAKYNDGDTIIGLNLDRRSHQDYEAGEMVNIDSVLSKVLGDTLKPLYDRFFSKKK